MVVNFVDERYYIAIDLKSFYASVECVDRGLDPLNTNLVVADKSRTEKTICLAVSPSLKAFGVGGRPRLFEVNQRVDEVNALRKIKSPQKELICDSFYGDELERNPQAAVSFITAPPRMGRYLEISAQIYGIYLKYIAPEDIHSYSVDEVFIEVTHYLRAYRCTPRFLAVKIIKDVLETTGITATAGIGTNMYLCKVAMDIVAKKMPADKNGVRIAELNENTYRRLLWNHKPLTDFWRIGRGYEKKLQKNYLYTMGDIARCSLKNEDLLYKLFGVNAELLIDHAWGYEPCTMAEVKAYKPKAKSLCTGQVLKMPYTFEKARTVIKEMADSLSLELVEKGLYTNQIVITVGYDIENLNTSEKIKNYEGEFGFDSYGRAVPKHAHGTENLEFKTSSSSLITAAVTRLYDRIINKSLLVRRLNITANNIEAEITAAGDCFQLDLFTDYEKTAKNLKREKNMQKAIIKLKHKYGKNAVLKAIDFTEGATAIERNSQIGGHNA